MRSSVARGTITAPPSKSYTHRAMVLGALTKSHFLLKNPLISEDTKATMDALFALGSEVRTNAHGVSIFCDHLRPSPGVIDARNSGTTIRLMAGIASLLPSTTTLTGDESLLKRPMGPLVDALTQLGAECRYLREAGTPPLAISGPITRASAEIKGDVSSQFVSSLLIACAKKQGETAIHVDGQLRSRPYVDITIQMLREFGGEVEERESGFRIPGDQKLAKDSYVVPGDYSSAAFPLAAAAITGGDVTIRNLDKGSPQGDRAIADHLRTFGAKVVISSSSIRVLGDELRGAEIDVRHTPDLFPVLAVLGSLARGRTVLKGGENLRSKESDRIAATTAFLSAMGANILPRDDGCVIEGVERLRGATVATHGDHRILMAAAVAALVSTTETRIEDDVSYAVSYPGFLRDMHQLGCRLEVRN
ncbi:MAG: 3-phosphoshikimate 1-carboxyvinyltransferase [Thermoplasmata archaeon]